MHYLQVALQTAWLLVAKSVQETEDQHCLYSGITLRATLRQVTWHRKQQTLWCRFCQGGTPRGYQDFTTLAQRTPRINGFMPSQWSKQHPDIYKQFLIRGKPSYDLRGTWLNLKAIPALQIYRKQPKVTYSQWSVFNDSIYVGRQDYSPLALNLLLYLGWVLVWEPQLPITKYRLTLASNKTARLKEK